MWRFNPGIPFEKWEEHLFEKQHGPINLPAIQRHVASLCYRRGKDKQSQIASLLHAVTCLDLTTLCGDDTKSNVVRLCNKAHRPINQKILSSLGFDPSEISCAAVCVYPSRVTDCVAELAHLKSSVKVAAVAAGFPSGQYILPTRKQEILSIIDRDAEEIDIVIDRELVLTGQWRRLYLELEVMREAAAIGATLKTIISAGELGTLENVYKASLIAMAAGTDFIKTSTGKESVNATLEIGTVMARAIHDYYKDFGYKVGFKAAGGIRTAKDVLLWQELMRWELNENWLYPDLFRIGASSLLGDIEQTLSEYVTGNAGKAYIKYL